MTDQIISIHLVGGPADGETYAARIPAPTRIVAEAFSGLSIPSPVEDMTSAKTATSEGRFFYRLRSFFFFYGETFAYVAEGMNIDEAGATLFKRLSPPRAPRTGPPTMGPTERPRT
jgi:hypothetical protein